MDGRASRRTLSGDRCAGSLPSRICPECLRFAPTPPSDRLKGGELRVAKAGYKLYQDWTAGRLPRVIVVLDPACDAVLRRLLRREFRERRPLWRRHHAGTDSLRRKAIPRNRPRMGPRCLWRIHRRMGKPGLAGVLSRLLQRGVGVLSRCRRLPRVHDDESLRRQERVLDRRPLRPRAETFRAPSPTDSSCPPWSR